MKQPAFTKEVFFQFWRVAVPFFKSEVRYKAFKWLFLLLSLSIAVSAANVVMSYANRDFMTALSNRNERDFYVGLTWYVGTFLIAIPVAVFYRYSEERLALLWRQWMTEFLVRRYLLRRSYYQIRSYSEIDNPDQRIAEDVRNFSATTLSFLLISLNSTITLIAFIDVLSSISWTLVGALIVYAVVGTYLTFKVGRKLVKLNYRQLKQEANFRYGLIRVRDNAESIAFFRGEPREWIDLKNKIYSVVKNTFFVIGWNRNLAFFTTSYNYVAIIVPILIVAPLYLHGNSQFGVIPQAAGAFAQVLAALSLLITQFERLSAFTAGVTRLGGLWDALDNYHSEEPVEEENSESEENQNRLILEKVSVTTPDNSKTLIQELDLHLEAGNSLLIMGESGTGKSSLLRTIAGLWTPGGGEISRPKLRNMMFLPQKPYMVLGNLRAQLQYPARERERLESDASLREILNKVNLDSILARVDDNLSAKLDWSNILSLGEQQRISFARLLHRRPKVAFLDEATSALDEENEKLLYSLLRELNICFVSVGHRSTLLKYHDLLLIVKKDGTWEFSKNEACEAAAEIH